MTLNEIVTAVVAAEIDKRGLTRAAFGRLVGHQPAWVTRKLDEQRLWTLDDLALLSERLAIPASWFLMPPAGSVTRQYVHLHDFALAA